MKLYSTQYTLELDTYTEFTSSDAAASKVRTRAKKLGADGIKTKEVEIDPTRSGLIKFLNDLTAHSSWVSASVAEKLNE